MFFKCKSDGHYWHFNGSNVMKSRCNYLHFIKNSFSLHITINPGLPKNRTRWVSFKPIYTRVPSYFTLDPFPYIF